MEKIKQLLLFSLLLLMICVSGFSVSKSKDDQSNHFEKVIRVGILRTPNDVNAAKQMGMIKKSIGKMGYRARFITFDSGVDANKALMSNSIDVATMGDTNAIVAMAAHLPAKMVWVNDVIGSNEQLVLRRSLAIHHWKDLAGKKIATPFASTSHYSLMMLLKKHHLLGKVTLVDMQTEEIVAAWNRGDIDGAYTWEPSLSNLVNRTKLMDSEELSRQGYLTANVTLATNQFIKKHPTILRAFIACLSKVHDNYHHNPKTIYKSTANALGLTAKETKKQIGTATWVPSDKMKHFTNQIFRKQFFSACQFMCNQQLLNSQPTYEECCQFITSRFMK